MKRTSIVLCAAGLLAACAPARPATPSSPTPPARTEPVPATPTARNSNAPPPAWWLATTDASGNYGTSVDRAYRELLAGRAPRQTVVVAVIDSGVDITHQDLAANIWTNAREVPGNQRDDDGNGYVDDVHGWDFIGGADGRAVDVDTYEVTRLYAACQAPAGAGGAGVGAGEGTPRPADCAAVAAEFQKRADNYRQMKERQRELRGYVALLQAELKGDSLTVANVERLRPLRADVRQAQAVYLQVTRMGFTLEDMAEATAIMKHKVDPAFNPRPIVGDDYADVTQRNYGNPDVVGPDASHGTGVAGVIGAQRGNGLGEDGIAPAVRIMVLRAAPDGDERDKDVANAIRYAAENGARVINMSFGKTRSPFKQAVDEAVKHATSKGVLLVHSAGNEAVDLAREPRFPTAKYLDGGQSDTWLEVGASGWNGVSELAAQFTNYGAQQVDVFAPGVAIHTTDLHQGWQWSSGTSFAAPVVAGVAALIMAYYPELDARAVKQIILDSATPLRDQLVFRPSDQRPGTPREQVRFGELSRTGAVVNAYAALELAAERAAGSGR